MEPLAKAKKVVLFSFFLSVAVVINIVEFFLPRPLPYVKLGLSNLLVILTLVYFNGGSAFFLAVMKSILASLILGYFMSITFYLSLGGTIASSLVMWFWYRISKGRVSLYFISIWGAVIHGIVQIWIIFTFFLKNSIIFVNLAPLLISSIVTGVFNGWMSNLLINRMKKGVFLR